MGDVEQPDYRDLNLIISITSDVMKCLAAGGFFEELDNRLCPTEPLSKRELCAGKYSVSESILQTQGYNESAIADVAAVLAAQGGHCDCEILYNVAETSRLKAEYWRPSGQKNDRPLPHKNSK